MFSWLFMIFFGNLVGIPVWSWKEVSVDSTSSATIWDSYSSNLKLVVLPAIREVMNYGILSEL